MANVIRDVLRPVKKWAKRHSLIFDLKLFPEKHGKSKIHWNGVGRMSPEVAVRLSAQWTKFTGLHHSSKCVKSLRSRYAGLAYVVKYKLQESRRCIPIRGRSVVVWTGEVYRRRASVVKVSPVTDSQVAGN